MDRARAEIAFCERILAKTGETVLTATLRGAERLEHWQHFPKGDVHDTESGAVWFYHCHPKSPTQPEDEHGHFHCFVRPEGTGGPIPLDCHRYDGNGPTSSPFYGEPMGRG